MILVDTSIWFAANVAEDPDHDSARKLLLAAGADFFTTAYVVDELLTLLVVRRQRHVAVRIGNGFWSRRACELIGTTPEDVAAAWAVFVQFDDKHWSFTDCVSYAVMKRLEIKQALSLDDHFRQFGFVSVLP